MQFGVAKECKRMMSSDIVEAHYFNNDIIATDTFILKAIHAFTFAPTECIARLVAFWEEEDAFYAVKSGRIRLNFPTIKLYRDYFHRLRSLAKSGVAVRYIFIPEYQKALRDVTEKDTESVFGITSYGAQMYKKLLQSREMSFDPRESFANPQDVFSCCLRAICMAPFFRSPYLKKVEFKQSIFIEKKRHNYGAAAIFNPSGRDGDDAEDTIVMFEGITFRTDETVVTTNTRYKGNVERIKELYSIFMEKQQKNPVYVVFCCEDAVGVKHLQEIVMENASYMFDKCLFTTGNILHASNAIDKPEMLRNCFMCFEKTDDGEKSGYIVVGATGHYFLQIDERR